MSTTTPRLRSDLRSEPVEDAQGVLYFDVSDPKSGGVLRLFDFECAVGNLAGAVVGGNWGYTARPGTMTHWPGGLALAFPAAGSVSGRLVLAEGDVNLTFKRYIERPITLTIEHDHITKIEGSGVDAELMRSYIAAWATHEGDRAAYAVSHVGYGLNAGARWDSMALYDKRDFNGTELRAFAGNFLYSTGANETAGRYTAGHFDLPLRHCSIALDGAPVVEQGRVLP